MYTNSVLSLSRSCSEAGTLGELRRVAAPLMEQLTFLARVCAVEEGGLPTGVALLSRLLDVSVHVSNIAQWANSGFFVQWVYWVYLFSQNTHPLCAHCAMLQCMSRYKPP